MRGLIRSTAAAAACLAIAVPAVAADIPTPPVFVQVPAYVPPPPVAPEPQGGWYLRGDIGYKIYAPPVASLPYPNPNETALINESLSNTWLVGFGIGFDTGRGLRADLTLDYEFPAQFEGQLLCPSAPCQPGPLYSTETADISALTLLANVYWDFARIYAFTPYIGAGIGLSRLTVSNVHSVNPDNSEQDHLGASTWNLAWALTAGTGISLTRQLALDINYRYLHLGDATSGPIPFPDGDTQFVYENIAAHEVRAGLRYTFN